jgi:hypothetical protein
MRLDEIAAREPLGLETRCSFLGACAVLEETGVNWSWEHLERLADTTLVTLALRRLLAERFECAPTKEAVATARAATVKANCRGYVSDLLRSSRIVGLIVDKGTPGYISYEEFDDAVDVSVYRAHRVDPWILAFDGEDFDSLVASVLEEAEKAASHPRTVAFKSYIHAYTGCDIGDSSYAEAKSAYELWRHSDDWPTAKHPKAVWDFVLHRIMEIASKHGKAMHFHLGGVGPLRCFSRPFDMYPFLDKYDSQPIVLIHSGYPWINETSYLAATFPSVYLDLSEITVWAPSQTDWVLEMMLGWVPGSKILYGSDTCTEPEQYWLGATFARSSLERSLQRLIERDLLSREQALLMGQGVLSRNTREVHGIS